MTTSMAAAIAASIPAPQTAPAPAAPVYEAIPASMSKVIDVEAEIPVTSVQLDALVVTKIVKHCSEAQSSTQALGLLLGIDLDGTLEINNSFALPHQLPGSGGDGDDDKEKAASKSLARYQASMLRSLKEVQGEDSVIGFYQSTTLGAFYSQSLIELQALHQEKIRHGGVVILHDVLQASRGNAAFRAFRLTKNFLAAFRKRKFSATSLAEHHLTFSSIMEEVPLKIRTNALVSTFLQTLSKPSVSGTSTNPLTAPAPALAPSYTPLDILATGLTTNLERILEGLDDYKTEEGNLAYLTRQIARERARAEAYVAKRREENASRVAQGLAPLPEDDVSRMFKIPQEPNRLASLLLLGQIDAYSQSLADTSTTRLIKMYAAKAGSS